LIPLATIVGERLGIGKAPMLQEGETENSN
jgi:hypothetical protein